MSQFVGGIYCAHGHDSDAIRCPCEPVSSEFCEYRRALEPIAETNPERCGKLLAANSYNERSSKCTRSCGQL
jgi:hypothetical protein